mgnify:CR=1 FL=1
MEIKNHSKMLKDAALLLGGNGLNAACQLATTLLLANKLSPDTWGGIAVIISYTLLIETLAATKTWQLVSSHAFPSLDRSPKRFARKLSALFASEVTTNLLATILGILLLPIAIQLMNLPDSIYWCGIIYSISILFRCSGSAGAILRLLDRYLWQSIHAGSLGVTRIAAITLTLSFTESPLVILAVLATIESIWHIGLLIAAWLVLQNNGVRWNDLNRNIPRRLRRQNWRLIGTSHITTLIKVGSRELDVLFVSAFISPETAGIVKVYRSVLRSLLLLSDPLANAAFPRFIDLHSKHAPIEQLNFLLQKLIKTGLFIATFAAASLSTAVFLMWEKFLQTPSPLEDGYFATYAIGIWISVAFFCVAPANLSLGRYGFAMKLNIAAAIAYIVALFSLIPFLGTTGAGIAFLISQSIWAGCYYLSFFKLEKQSYTPSP